MRGIKRIGQNKDWQADREHEAWAWSVDNEVTKTILQRTLERGRHLTILETRSKVNSNGHIYLHK